MTGRQWKKCTHGIIGCDAQPKTNDEKETPKAQFLRNSWENEARHIAETLQGKLCKLKVSNFSIIS